MQVLCLTRLLKRRVFFSIPESLRDLTTLNLADGQTIETSLVIGADGFKSVVRESMGKDYTSWNYDQSGVVATLNIQVARYLWFLQIFALVSRWYKRCGLAEVYSTGSYCLAASY